MTSVLTLEEVEALARRAHADQRDKAGRPYVEHLAAVADGVRRRGGSAEQIAAAWLHDAIEDGVVPDGWLTTAPLTPHTKELIDAMTRRTGESLETYAARLRATPGALLIKEADVAHNADPDRLARLDPATREQLAAKYARTRQLLGLPCPTA